MERLQPSDLFYIALMTGMVVGSAFVGAYWPEISRFFSGVFHHYVDFRTAVVVQPEPDENDGEMLDERNGETVKHGITEANTERNGQFHLLARFVHAGLISETDGLRVGFGVAPGKSRRYREARTALHAAMAEVDTKQHYRTLDEQGRPMIGDKPYGCHRGGGTE